MRVIRGYGRLLAGVVGQAVYPPLCPGCGAETAAAHTLCPGCWRDLHFLAGPGCGRCGRDMPGLQPGESLECDDCRAHPPLWRRGCAVFAYAGTGRRLVLSLKHADRLETAPMLSGWMRRAGRDLLSEADLLVPIPLHWSRRVKRRYNQSAELARALADRADGPVFRADILRRTRRTPSQEGRSREERARNLAGALNVGDAARTALRGRRVLLIDDVMTTGATLNAGAAALLQAGAASVDVLVLALVGGSVRSYLADTDDEEYRQ